MKDLMGQTIRVGDKVAYSVTSFAGYLGVGVVVEVVPEKKDLTKPAGVVPSKLKIEVTASSKYVGARRGKVITLGNDATRAHHPKGRLDTVFVYERAKPGV
jgi:hypothetical protein